MECLEENENVADLFELFSFKRTIEQVWEIPSTITSQELNGYVTVIQDSLKNPKSTSKNTNSKRNTRKKNGSQEKVTAYVSEQFIQDSDEDINDEEFFQREAQLREKWSAINSGSVPNTQPETESVPIDTVSVQHQPKLNTKMDHSDAESESESSRVSSDQDSDSHLQISKKRKTVILEEDD